MKSQFQFGELKKRNLPIKTYKLLTIKLLYSMFFNKLLYRSFCMEMNGGFLVTKINSLETGFSRRFSVKRILMRLMEPRDVFFMCCGRRMVSQSGHSRLNAD